MIIKEAEEFFKQCNGNGYYMCLNDEPKYHEFQALHLSDDILDRWKQEKVQLLYEKLWDDKNDTWLKLHEIFELIRSPKINTEQSIKLFLNEVNKCMDLDNLSKIILIEEFAGKTESQEDGICFFICKYYPNLNEEMNIIVKKLMEFQHVEDLKLKKRLKSAIDKYEKVFNKFSKNKKRKTKNEIGFKYK